jgi:hypothetical protein
MLLHIKIIGPFLHVYCEYGLLCLSDEDVGLVTGVTDGQAMLSPPRNLILPTLVFPGVRWFPFFIVFCTGCINLIYIWGFFFNGNE